MIVASIDERRSPEVIEQIEGLGLSDEAKARLKRGLDWLAENDWKAQKLGRAEIDGDALFANVMAFETSSPDSKDHEAHRAYIDVHYVVEGEEHMAVAPVEACEAVTEYNERDDFALYRAPKDQETWVTAHAGDVVVTEPGVAHKPGCCGENGPAPLKKAVVKVAL